MKSKLKPSALIIPVLIIAFTSILIHLVVANLPIAIKDIRSIDVFMGLLLLFTWTWLVFGEFRTKVIQIEIQKSQIQKKNYLGLDQKYNFEDIDGFQTSMLTGKSGTYEYLYFIKNGEKIVKISEFYHRNYSELKTEISIHIKNLGEIPFSFTDEYKEIFK